MTEEEAKTKWCPFARIVVGLPDGEKDAKVDAGSPTLNRVGIPGGRVNLPAPTLCIGSACMAFRQHGWRDKEDGQLKSAAYERADPQHWEPMFHCGLAGKP